MYPLRADHWHAAASADGLEKRRDEPPHRVDRAQDLLVPVLGSCECVGLALLQKWIPRAARRLPLLWKRHIPFVTEAKTLTQLAKGAEPLVIRALDCGQIIEAVMPGGWPSRRTPLPVDPQSLPAGSLRHSCGTFG